VRVYSHEALKWDGHKLRLKSGRLLAAVEPDSKWPNMYRVWMRGGRLSDMANISWAKEAAVSLALTGLSKQGRDIGRSEASPAHQNIEAR
jgi:hypothetical protein